ncbi:MAG TPA: metalloregulator ArsR/SmtB family transcription factor [Acidimicrobiales bacterium]|nr:metalloregulator ArsR/SmtB family transcription factor [Acidimicrobiales bacterium]
MPTLDTSQNSPQAPVLPVAVRTSLVTDLVWAMWVHADEPDPIYPARLGRFGDGSDLAARLAGFWDDGQGFFTEVLVVADRVGALFEEDPERLFELLEAGAAGPGRTEPLASEPPDDQRRFRARLKRLHDSSRLRRAWIALIRDVWAAVGPDWEKHGRSAAEAIARELRQKTGPSAGPAQLIQLLHCDNDSTFDQLLWDLAGEGGKVLIVPARYARRGMFVSFPGSMIVTPGTPAAAAGPTDETRNRARRFKALGDPTRLAVLEAIGRRPRTVGELADLFGLAQPTVSNHVRVLRDAGLVVMAKDSSRRLEPNVPALDQLFAESQGVVAGEPVGIT